MDRETVRQAAAEGDRKRAREELAAELATLRTRAETAEARVAELEAENVRLAGQAMCEGERANEAEAERDAMRAVVEAAKVIMRRYDEGGFFYSAGTLDEQISEMGALSAALAALPTKEG